MPLLAGEGVGGIVAASVLSARGPQLQPSTCSVVERQVHEEPSAASSEHVCLVEGAPASGLRTVRASGHQQPVPPRQSDRSTVVQHCRADHSPRRVEGVPSSFSLSPACDNRPLSARLSLSPRRAWVIGPATAPPRGRPGWSAATARTGAQRRLAATLDGLGHPQREHRRRTAPTQEGGSYSRPCPSSWSLLCRTAAPTQVA